MNQVLNDQERKAKKGNGIFSNRLFSLRFYGYNYDPTTQKKSFLEFLLSLILFILKLAFFLATLLFLIALFFALIKTKSFSSC